MTLEGIARDIRYGSRLLKRDPGFTLVAVLTMALGIGATATLFTVAYGVLLRPLPWPDPDQLVRIEERRGGLRGRTPWTMTNGSYHAWRDKATTIEGLGAWMSSSQVLWDTGDPERLPMTAATPSLFSILRARPALGRLFVEQDAEPGRRGTAILSYGLWQQRFGGDRAVIGRAIRLEDRSYDVVGVMPR